jgi:Cu+-exporting ATPase
MFNKKAVDPVCGMKIAVDKALYTIKYENKTFYFCSLECKKAFEDNPKRYIENNKKFMTQNSSMHDRWRCC